MGSWNEIDHIYIKEAGIPDDVVYYDRYEKDLARQQRDLTLAEQRKGFYSHVWRQRAVAITAGVVAGFAYWAKATLSIDHEVARSLATTCLPLAIGLPTLVGFLANRRRIEGWTGEWVDRWAKRHPNTTPPPQVDIPYLGTVWIVGSSEKNGVKSYEITNGKKTWTVNKRSLPPELASFVD